MHTREGISEGLGTPLLLLTCSHLTSFPSHTDCLPLEELLLSLPCLPGNMLWRNIWRGTSPTLLPPLYGLHTCPHTPFGEFAFSLSLPPGLYYYIPWRSELPVYDTEIGPGNFFSLLLRTCIFPPHTPFPVTLSHHVLCLSLTSLSLCLLPISSLFCLSALSHTLLWGDLHCAYCNFLHCFYFWDFAHFFAHLFHTVHMRGLSCILFLPPHTCFSIFLFTTHMWAFFYSPFTTHLSSQDWFFMPVSTSCLPPATLLSLSPSFAHFPHFRFTLDTHVSSFSFHACSSICGLAIPPLLSHTHIHTPASFHVALSPSLYPSSLLTSHISSLPTISSVLCIHIIISTGGPGELGGFYTHPTSPLLLHTTWSTAPCLYICTPCGKFPLPSLSLPHLPPCLLLWSRLLYIHTYTCCII